MTTGKTDLEEKLRRLHEYSPCDVSDALLKLQKTKPGEVARAGHLADILPISLPQSKGDTQKVIAPACTLKLVSKDATPDTNPPAENSIPKGSHWVDMTEPGTIVVIDQPQDQKCAAVGGIMAQRMKIRGVAGCIVGGRVRDLAELRETHLPSYPEEVLLFDSWLTRPVQIFALGKSTVGTGAEATAYARNVRVSITGVDVSPGDIIFCDTLEGVVVIPQDLLDETLSLMPKLIAADDKVKEAVVGGMTVAEAFRTFRN